jgi:hypothetical protein
MGVREIDLPSIPLIGKSFAKESFQKTTERTKQYSSGGGSQIMTRSLLGYN